MNKIFIFYCDLKRNEVIEDQKALFKEQKSNNFIKQFNFLKSNEFKFSLDHTKNLINKFEANEIKEFYGLDVLDNNEYYNFRDAKSNIKFCFKRFFDQIPKKTMEKKLNQLKEKDKKLVFGPIPKGNMEDGDENYIYHRDKLPGIYLIQQNGIAFGMDDKILERLELSAIIFSCIIKDLMENKIVDIDKVNEIYYVCHDKHVYKPGTLYTLDSENLSEFIKYLEPCLKKQLEDKVLKIIAFQHETTNVIYQDIIKRLGKITVDEIFKTINEIDTKKKYNELKHQIISLWLPLAIDIQGLSEVSEDNAKDYFEKIKEDNYLSEIKDSIKKQINELNEILDKENKIEEDKKIYLNTLIDEFNNNSNIEKINQEYLNQGDDLFLPKWLETFAKNNK